MTAPWWARLRDELLRIRYRLLLVNGLIVSVPIVGIAFARVYEREQLRALEDDMVHQGQVLRETIAVGTSDEGRQRVLTAIAAQTRTRIRILDARGQVTADSHAHGPPEGREAPWGFSLQRTARAAPMDTPDEPSPKNLAGRPEVGKALAGRYGAFTRVWRFGSEYTARGERVYLFSALPLEDAAGQPAGAVYLTRSTLPVLAALYRLRASLFRLLIAALAATAVLSLFLAATIARPLSRLGRIAHRIAAGDRRQSLALGRRDEIGHLARAFDVMARKLDQRARDAARMAADISHEFKSPLTSIRGAAELLQEGAADDPRARQRFLANILADAGRLDRLVSRLLELSRLEADEAPFETVELPDFLAEAVASAASPEVPVTVVHHGQRRTLRVRPGQLAAAVRNLIENARQHAAVDTGVTLTVQDHGSGLRLSVHNHGTPISPANLTKVWDRFFTTRAQSGGSGLGLPIVAVAVAAHGGRTFVTSDAAGTEFGFDLPPDPSQPLPI